MIKLCTPNISSDALSGIQHCLETGMVSTSGENISLFEQKIGTYIGSNHVFATNSATSALHLALIGAGVQTNHGVIIPNISFVATANVVEYQGAVPILIDTDSYLQLDAQKLTNYLENKCILANGNCMEKNSGRIIKALIVVHVFGGLADMDQILPLCKKYNIQVIEDAAGALGSKFKNEVHPTTQSDFGVFSFNANKIITAGGGGILVAKEKSDLEKLRHIGSTAKTYPNRFEHDSIGYNYKITNLQATLGLSQFQKLDTFLDKKNENYQLYCQHLESIYWINPVGYSTDIYSNNWFYAFRIKDKEPFEIIDQAHQKGIEIRPLWQPFSKMNRYKKITTEVLSSSQKEYSQVILLPCSTHLKKEEVLEVVKFLKSI